MKTKGIILTRALGTSTCLLIAQDGNPPSEGQGARPHEGRVERDGEISCWYAMRFAAVGKTLTADQKQTLLKLRNLDAKYICQGAYLYSAPIKMPEIPNTDHLFTASAESKNQQARN